MLAVFVTGVSTTRRSAVSDFASSLHAPRTAQLVNATSNADDPFAALYHRSIGHAHHSSHHSGHHHSRHHSRHEKPAEAVPQQEEEVPGGLSAAQEFAARLPHKRHHSHSKSSNAPCVFVANLHVRKCGGTTVRAMFQGLAAEGTWAPSGSYCSAMDLHHKDADNAHGRHWSETHCDEDIDHFTAGVRSLRAAIEPAGCKVVSTLLLREPVDQLISEWVYFNTEPDKQGTANPAEWAPHSSDNILRWLLKSATDFWDGPKGGGQTPNTITRAEGKPLNVSDCDAAMEGLSAHMDEIDLVGTMDTPEEFAQCTPTFAATTCSLGGPADIDLGLSLSPTLSLSLLPPLCGGTPHPRRLLRVTHAFAPTPTLRRNRVADARRLGRLRRRRWPGARQHHAPDGFSRRGGRAQRRAARGRRELQPVRPARTRRRAQAAEGDSELAAGARAERVGAAGGGRRTRRRLRLAL